MRLVKVFQPPRSNKHDSKQSLEERKGARAVLDIMKRWPGDDLGRID